MPEYIKTIPEAERAVLVGLILPGQDERVTLDYLNELAFLAETAGAIPLKRFTQKLDAPNPKTFVGTGKMREIVDCVKELEADLLIFDDELSPSQLRNVEQMAKCKVLDRTSLILDIFARRARTSYAKVQVELAQYQYILPRLAGMWTHLERQRGGIGLRGPGEREIETDRRVIRDRIARLQDHLKQIDRQMVTQRKNREKYVRVALVGYTNAGKSTLMNLLSKSDVFAENKLFATLDTTVRKVIIDNLPFLLSDTVGFIRKLPHHLVESFKSTLDEVREADILLHVVDISHAGFEEQIKVVEETLHDLGASGKPTYLVFNKIDAYTYIPRDEDDLLPPEAVQYSLEELKNTWMGRNNRSSIFISAREKTNLSELKQILYEKVREIHVNRYPYENFLY
ncbi:MAG TPA: GTPase HflX [Bacteroidetes bacterium]|nr:GTPase HflX [Bacteroidota bacterium]